MKTTLEQIERPNRRAYSVNDMAKPVNFYYANRSARSVSLIGDFNSWNANVHPMRQREDGWWFVEVPLTHGHHRYLFVVDGELTLDPRASGSVTTEFLTRASVIAVS